MKFKHFVQNRTYKLNFPLIIVELTVPNNLNAVLCAACRADSGLAKNCICLIQSEILADW